MPPSRAALVFVGLVTGLAACATGSSVRVHAEPNPAADLSRYATYAWASAPLAAAGSAGGDPWASVPSAADRDAIALDQQIRREIDAQLTRRGYVQVGSEQPDLVVDYRAGTRRKELQDNVGEYSRYRAEGGTGSWGDVWVGGYQEGQLQVLVADARRRTWVWQGTAAAVVNPSLRERRIPKAVAAMFESFPSRAR